jgi:hypothetical protein
MSRLNVAVKNDLQLLGLLRDEVKLQGHLLRADLKKRWDELEQEFSGLQERVGRAEVAGRQVAREMGSDVDQLVATLRSGYEGIRTALRSQAPRH